MDDRRNVPLYSVPECARYLGLPASTVSAWVNRAESDIIEGRQPLVEPAGFNPTALSFTNLVELHTLATLRRKHEKSLDEVRSKIKGSAIKHPLASKEFLAMLLDRVDLDQSGFAIRFYPFTRGFGRDDPKLVVIDPDVKFGRPVVTGTGVPTSVIAKFMKAGESVLELAEDYRVQPSEIEEAVRYELAW